MTSAKQPLTARTTAPVVNVPTAQSPSTDPSPGDGSIMSTAGREAFEAELSRLKISNNSGPLDSRFATVGLVGAVAGLVVILVCFVQTQALSDIRDQMEMLVLALFGLGLGVLGSVIYARNSMTRFMRYWLLRIIYEQRHPASGSDNHQIGA
ncbi:hypothetical protein [Microtetraspora sp. NBRC 16547]|uniref:hypothetical protein n=1 Tax=Microtetraspora sp. NBRC 16547 TaxID=3030993 RepID=UPI0024A2D7C5|nr:hypothetical protein [Microtetraspora sp. NBRC 16547]GLX02666.1 hypothetical protein Misp02_67520 [Microtetraspora sp. NBRC 16547]